MYQGGARQPRQGQEDRWQFMQDGETPPCLPASAAWCFPVAIVTSLVLMALVFFSFDTLEYQEMGINYSWISESIEPVTYPSGRYYLGLGNRFIKFPSVVKSVSFVDDFAEGLNGPALTSRTMDGVTVRLEVSFQYRLKFQDVYNLYVTLGDDYEKIFVRMAIEQLTIASTMHNAHNFFNNRTFIGQEMHRMLSSHFSENAFSEVPFFQLRTVHLPTPFENAIQDTQVKQQEIQIAVAEQNQNRVKYQTKVLQAEQAVHVLQNKALGEASAVLAKNEAYCNVYKLTQTLQAEAYAQIMKESGWNPSQLLDYVRIRAVRAHPSAHTVINL